MTQRSDEQPNVEQEAGATPLPVPTTVTYAFYALLASAGLLVAGALSYFAFTDELKKELVKSNQKLIDQKSANARNPYTEQLLAHDLHTVRLSLLMRAVLIGVVLAAIGWQLLRGRSWTRWALVILAVVLQLPLSVLAIGQPGPLVPNLLTALVGLTFIVVLVLVFLPPSRQFFLSRRPVPVAGGAPGRLLGKLLGGGAAGTASLPDEAAPRPARAPSKTRNIDDAAASTTPKVARNKSKGR